MSLDWNNALPQVVIWAIILLWFMRKYAKKFIRRFRVGRVVLLIILIAILLGLIPNLQFGGPGNGGGDGGDGGDNAAGGGSPAAGRGSSTSVDLHVRVMKVTGDRYQLWLEPNSGLSFGPIEMNENRGLQQGVIKAVQSVRDLNGLRELVRCRLTCPPPMRSGIGRTALEDVLRSAGCLIVVTE